MRETYGQAELFTPSSAAPLK